MSSARHLTRRTLLRRTGGLATALVAPPFLQSPLSVHASPQALRSSWTLDALALNDLPALSAPLSCDFLFNALESAWDADVPTGSTLDLSLRTRTVQMEWGEWLPLHADTHARNDGDAVSLGDLAIVAPATQLQYRIDATPAAGGELPQLRSLTFTAVSTLDTDPAPIMVHIDEVTGIRIVSRAGWGADERLRFDKDRKDLWSPEYRPIQKVIVHHTVTVDPDPDPAATIRAIYQYHAVTRGWGDIGYNFLVAPDGTVYEGRSGGMGVVGGHTYGYNYGSLGIAMLGTYRFHSVNGAARGALKALITRKAGDLDPMGKGFFIDRDHVWNISGHRSLTQTDCPGDRFYLSLSNLRRELKGLPVWDGDPAIDPLAANPPDAQGSPSTGAQPMSSAAKASPATPAPPRSGSNNRYFTETRHNLGGAFRAYWEAHGGLIQFGFPMTESFAERNTDDGKSYTVQYFERARFELHPEKEGEQVLLGRLGAIVARGRGQEQPFQPVGASPDTATQRFFPAVAHTLAGVFKGYWETHGGLPIFGFPLSEPFEERSATDGKTYVVQYFERNRFERHPEHAGTVAEVALGLLGREILRKRGWLA